MEIDWPTVALFVGIAAAVVGIGIGLYQVFNAKNRLDQRKAREAKDQEKADKDAAESRERLFEDRRHDLQLLRRAIIRELELLGNNALEFSWGHPPGGLGSSLQIDHQLGEVRRYWLDGDILRIGIREGHGGHYQVWAEEGVPESSLEASRKKFSDFDYLGSMLGKFRYEPLLVRKHFPGESLKTLE